MKRLFLFLCTISLVLGMTGIVGATPYSSIVDWNTQEIRGASPTRNGMWIYDFNNFSYTHDVSFNPPAASINSATLTLSHFRNANSSTEAWFITPDQESISLGYLNQSQSGWVDEDFQIPSSLYGDIIGGSWSISFKLKESNPDVPNCLAIDKSVLHGDYTPVPEPGTLLLLGSGLVALIGYGKFRFNRSKK